MCKAKHSSTRISSSSLPARMQLCLSQQLFWIMLFFPHDVDDGEMKRIDGPMWSLATVAAAPRPKEFSSGLSLSPWVIIETSFRFLPLKRRIYTAAEKISISDGSSLFFSSIRINNQHPFSSQMTSKLIFPSHKQNAPICYFRFCPESCGNEHTMVATLRYTADSWFFCVLKINPDNWNQYFCT